MPMIARSAVLIATAVLLSGLAACQSTGADDPKYGSVENWPSTQAIRNLGNGD